MFWVIVPAFQPPSRPMLAKEAVRSHRRGTVLKPYSSSGLIVGDCSCIVLHRFLTSWIGIREPAAFRTSVSAWHGVHRSSADLPSPLRRRVEVGGSARNADLPLDMGSIAHFSCARSFTPAALPNGRDAIPAGHGVLRRDSGLSASGQALQSCGQLLADLSAFTGDLLLEDQLEGIEMGLGDLEAGFIDRAAGRDQPAQRLADARHQGIAEARALALDVVHGRVEEVELFTPTVGSAVRGVEPNLRVVEIDARPFGVVCAQGGGCFL